jgi:hypothetical protein
MFWQTLRFSLVPSILAPETTKRRCCHHQGHGASIGEERGFLETGNARSRAKMFYIKCANVGWRYDDGDGGVAGARWEEMPGWYFKSTATEEVTSQFVVIHPATKSLFLPPTSRRGHSTSNQIIIPRPFRRRTKSFLVKIRLNDGFGMTLQYSDFKTKYCVIAYTTCRGWVVVSVVFLYNLLC